MKKIICQLCKGEIETPDYGDGTFDYSDVYDYRGFSFHEKCFDEGCKKVDYKRQEVMEVAEHSLKLQAGGEWANGGYKTMKIDSGGNPIVVRHIFQYFFSNRNFVEEFKKGMEFLFFILKRGISGYFLLHTSAKNDI